MVYQTDRLKEGTYGCWGGDGGGVLEEGTGREFGMSVCTLLYVTRVTSKDPLYSTGSSAQSSVTAQKEKE